MGFIKHGDGKIVSVIEEEDLTEEQKKAVHDSSKKVIKISDDKSSSDLKNAGR